MTGYTPKVRRIRKQIKTITDQISVLRHGVAPKAAALEEIDQYIAIEAARMNINADAFATKSEANMVTGMIDLRNKLTHEVEVQTDPSVRRLVDYAWECQHTVRWITALYAAKAAGIAPAPFD